MIRSVIGLCLLCQAALGGQLTVRIDPRWAGQPLVLNEVSLKNAAGNQMSISRLAFLLSHAQLKRDSGAWIGADDWVAFLDAEKQQLSFVLNGIPAETFTALRFDLGLDETMDKSDPARRPAGHPLHPDVNGLHWSWRGQYVFLAVEGRYQSAAGALDGFSYHLAGQSCRGTVEVPIALDLRGDQILTLGFDADRLFSASHRIDIAAATSTHSGDDGGLAERIADNAVQAFSILRLEPDLAQKADPGPADPGIPALIADRIPTHFPQAAWPQDNPLTAAGVALGQQLFSDTRLSINNTQSCASCHIATAGMADPRRVSIGAEGQAGTRNAMPLFNLAWKPSFFWDGRAPTLRDQVLRPIQDPTEMHETLDHVVTKLADLGPEFEKAFGSQEITAARIARALEQFLLTQIAATSRLDRTVTHGEKLTDQEQRGYQLFFTESDPRRGIQGADCFHCHGGAHFTNHQFLNNGLDAEFADAGRFKVTGNESDQGKFMVPSLRNVALTAPYMHDGRFTTLEEVIDHYDHGLKSSATLDPNLAKHIPQGGLRLSPEDKSALIAFLKTLTDEGRD
ncbi:MAG: c-type cytochrome [Verrucomicrobiales bacterium]|nr:c-type cytochrome [Verrucomicrobiales bacterium]MCP5557665.1 c-type cytochrome [Verrucomicrobiaceae bacterium]